jgi:hypothetical protein
VGRRHAGDGGRFDAGVEACGRSAVIELPPRRINVVGATVVEESLAACEHRLARRDHHRVQRTHFRATPPPPVCLAHPAHPTHPLTEECAASVREAVSA